MIIATEDFTKWAMGFSGCDGGNINGTIWFCGIEFGGNETEDKFAFNNISEPYLTDEQRKQFLSYRYNINLAKLYAAVIGEEVMNYYQIALRDKLFDRNSCTFKINLYPISFHHDSDDLWQEWLYRKTGLPTKSIYRAWCQINRFPKMREWIIKYLPKLIIATGSTYHNEFIMAFDSIETIYRNDKLNKKTLSDRDFAWLNINEDKTILVITPFLAGRHGLNSDKLLQDFGKEIQHICRNKFGENWK